MSNQRIQTDQSYVNGDTRRQVCFKFSQLRHTESFRLNREVVDLSGSVTEQLANVHASTIA
jgi:hypothetical protein